MPEQNRRRFLLGAGAAVAGTVGISSTGVFGASDGPQLVFTDINPEDEFLVVKNVSGEKMDLSDYVVDFGYENEDESQRATIEEGTTISAGGTLKIVADANEGEAGVSVDREYVMNNDGEDVYAILTPEGSVVARSDEEKYIGVPETTTTTTTTTESEETTTTTEEETTTEDETTTTEEETTTTKESTTTEDEETTTDEESGSGSDEQTTSDSDESTTTSNGSEEDDC